MNLTQQFLIISILPLSFIGMAVYLLRKRTRRRHVVGRWLITLLSAAVWASSILRFFGGRAFSYPLVFTWGLIGIYAFSLTIIGVLFTTFSHIDTPSNHNRAALAVGIVLWGSSLALESRIWPYEIPAFTLAGQSIHHFDIWYAVWTASWLVPLIAAFITTQRVNVGLPNSLYRNQVQYWLLVLVFFLAGGVLNAIQQTGPSGWHQAGVLLAIIAGFVGTISITQTYLPDLQLGLRQFLSRLSGTLIIFIFTLASLWFLVRILINLPNSTINNGNTQVQTTIVVLEPDDPGGTTANKFILNGNGGPGTLLDIVINGEPVAQTYVDASGKWRYELMLLPGTHMVDVHVADSPINSSTVSAQNLIILIAAAVLAGLLTLVFRLTNELMRRLFLPALALRTTVMTDYEKTIGYLPEPEHLGALFLRILQSNVGTDDVWFFVTENGPGGQLILRPFTSIGTEVAHGISFAHSSPMTHYLRHNNKPLSQYDIDTLDVFADMTAGNREKMTAWQRMLYLPLRAGQHLVGVVALGIKSSGESYDRQDNDLLQQLGEQFAPLPAQAQNLDSLQRMNTYVYQENQTLIRNKQHLQELVGLYQQFMHLVSPEIKRPFIEINQKMERLQKETADTKAQPIIDEISRQLEAAKLPIDNLVNLSARIQMRNQFNFELINMEDVTQNAMRKLRVMADARRVKIEFNVQTALPAVCGDAAQLQEAIQHLLHNAIKFNKIGGAVQMDCGVEGSHLYLRVIDTGVGIPEDRLANIWSGLAHTQKNGYGRGTGLGLALTRFIVAAHGGHVEAQSRYGSGSVFAIYLPLVFEE